MGPEISEFSYGFALTREIVSWAGVSSAPLFPSLVAEGKSGYDVKLDMPAAPLYLQFKRADCMTHPSAGEIVKGAPLGLPYHRFKVTQSGKSDQHDLLLSLEETGALVFYAAPRFHAQVEFDGAWQDNSVASRSIFVPPAAIGELDDKSHTVAYDPWETWLCSEPRQIETLDSLTLLNRALGRLTSDKRPLRARIPELIADLDAAERRAEERVLARYAAASDPAEEGRVRSHQQGLRSVTYDLVDMVGAADTPARRTLASRKAKDGMFPPPTPEIARRPPSSATAVEADDLHRLAEKAARLFNAQLFMLQPAIT